MDGSHTKKEVDGNGLNACMPCMGLNSRRLTRHQMTKDHLHAKRNNDACLANLGFNTRQANGSSEGPSASRLTFDPVLII